MSETGKVCNMCCIFGTEEAIDYGISLCYYIKGKKESPGGPPPSRIGYVYEAIKAHVLFKLQRNLGSGGREVEKL